MESDTYCNIDKKFKDDLRIFCHEMYNYLMARRYWYKNYPDPILVTKSSEFTEEIGKAVLVAWHENAESLRKMFTDDYPRYTERSDNFGHYATLRAKEITNESAINLAKQLVLASAFLLELYCYCFEIRNYSFLPSFVEFWGELFLNLFYDRFKSEYGWKKLRKECLKESKKYDEEKVEKNFPGSGKTEIKFNYFLVGKQKEVFVGKTYKSKIVSRFQIVDEKTEKKMLPPNANQIVSPRDATLNIISELGMESHQAVFDHLSALEIFVDLDHILETKSNAYQPKNVKVNVH